MTVDTFGCWDLNDLPYSAWLSDSTGAENTSVLKQHGSCLACQNVSHISQSLSNLSCDRCMSSVLPASGLEQSAGAEPGVSEDNERKLVCSLEWTWFQRSIHISMEIPSRRVRLTGFIREMKERVGGCNGCEKEQLELNVFVKKTEWKCNFRTITRRLFVQQYLHYRYRGKTDFFHPCGSQVQKNLILLN